MKCLFCGNDFNRKNRNRIDKYCSSSCASKDRWKNKDHSVSSRLWKKVDKSGSCWLWTGFVNNHGYGTIPINRRGTYVHRVSWELSNGKILNGLHVLHRCNTPRCVNPKHLYLGTPADNALDKVKAGKAAKKLNPEKVTEIKNLYRSGTSMYRLGKMFSVHPTNIEMIVKGTIWKSVS